jgi:hypothetical protein
MSTKQSTAKKKGGEAHKQSKIVLPKDSKAGNSLFDDLKNSRNDIIAAVAKYEGILHRCRENPNIVAHVTNPAAFSNNLIVLAQDIVHLNGEIAKVYNQHKHLSGNADIQQVTWAFGLLEQYAKIAVLNEESTYKIAREILIALEEGERNLIGKMKQIAEQHPEALAAAEAVLKKDDEEAQAAYDAQQAANPEVVTDVTFVEGDSKTIH